MSTHLTDLQHVHVVPHTVTLEPISQDSGTGILAKHCTCPGGTVMHVHEQPSTPTLHCAARDVAECWKIRFQDLFVVKLILLQPHHICRREAVEHKLKSFSFFSLDQHSIIRYGRH